MKAAAFHGSNFRAGRPMPPRRPASERVQSDEAALAAQEIQETTAKLEAAERFLWLFEEIDVTACLRSPPEARFRRRESPADLVIFHGPGSNLDGIRGNK